MTGEAAGYLAIALMAAITLATRVCGAMLVAALKPSPRLDRILEAMSGSAIAAVVVTFIAQNGLREAASVAVAGIVMLAFRQAAVAMVAGVAFAAAWYALAG